MNFVFCFGIWPSYYTERTGHRYLLLPPTTEVGFDLDNAGLVTMMRHGTVSTVLVFEKGKRHICSYQTEYMPFEICVNTKDVQNTLLENGRIDLDYIIEIRGAQAERTLFTIEISENADTPI